MTEVNFKEGDIVAVEFLDHAEGGLQVMECVVYGKLVSYNPEYTTTICSWFLEGSEKYDDVNNTYFNLVSKAIVSITPLEPR